MVAFGHEPTLAVALAVGALAATVIALRPNRALHRALALLLLLQALGLVLQALAETRDALEFRLGVYVDLAMPFAGLNFAYLFWREHTQTPQPSWRHAAARIAILAGGCIVLAAYMVDHALYFRFRPQEGAGPGPLYYIGSVSLAILTTIALLLAHSYRRADGLARERSFFLATMAFAVVPAFRGSFAIINTGAAVSTGNAALLSPFDAVVNLAAVVLLVVVGATLWKAQRDAADVMAYTATIAVSVLSAGLAFAVPGSLGIRLLFALNAVWVGVFVLLATYAVLRYEFFGIELRVRFALKQSTVVAILAGVFVVTSETLERLIAVSDNAIALGVAVGLAFVFRPIQYLAERFVERVMPNVKKGEEYVRRRRQEVYRAAVEVVLRDGKVADEEAHFLARLRTKLQIPPQEAIGIESAIGVRLTADAPTAPEDNVPGYV